MTQISSHAVGRYVASTAFVLSLAASFTACAPSSSQGWHEGQPLLAPVINDRITDFYANKKLMGLNQYDAQGNLLKTNAGGDNLKFDYVPGLVAKAIIEAAATFPEKPEARAWFYSVEDYANRCYASVPTVGKSLDDLNATKMYFTIAELTDSATGVFRDIANPETHAHAVEALDRAIQGLRDVNAHFVITPEVDAECAGGWWHKGVYPNQMWCDGQYMGPALLAQMVSKGYYLNNAEEDWQTITRQFDITWHKLWDADKRLLYHAFSADPKGEKAALWADPVTGRSKEYWGRACGWYFLALVDVLELMPEGIIYPATQSSLKEYPADCKARLSEYLHALAKGLKQRQDPATGCWYQLLAYDSTFVADSYQGKTCTPTANYLESSASSIFTAAYLKAMRLGLLSEGEYMPIAVKAMHGLVKQFLRVNPEDGSFSLIDDCASAGLGGASWGVRDGSAAYYLLGHDVTRITDYTEGKVYGAFILAATEYERLYPPVVTLN